MARINKVQQCLHLNDKYSAMRTLEKKLISELNLIIKQEEIMWFQRSRMKWLVDDDQNTKYYHLKTINKRKRRNKISMLKND